MAYKCAFTVVIAVLLQEWLYDFRGACSSSVLYAYKVFDGEHFIMQCASPHQCCLFNESTVLEQSTVWFRHEGGSKRELPGRDDSMVKVGNSLWFSSINDKHSGNYSCYTRNSAGPLAPGALHFLVDVMPKNVTVCPDYSESFVTLIQQRYGTIACPDVSCFTSAPKGAIQWYRNAAKQFNSSRVKLKDNVLNLQYVDKLDNNANFTCDHSYVEGLNWTFRRTVRVRALPQDTPTLPQILYPRGNQTEKVELGKPHTLTCRVQFGFERNFSPVVTWWVRYRDSTRMEPLGSPWRVDFSTWVITVKHNTSLQQVAERHLGATYICWAQNSIGNVSASMRLQRKPEVAVPLLVIVGPAAIVVLVMGISLLLWIYWLEIYLLYRAYISASHLCDTVSGKEYDAFVSCVSGSEEEDSILTGEALGLHLLPEVLEKQYGYRLYLMQRDPVPGGAYTEDVVGAVQKSRRVICVLSSSYLRSSCLFELETSLKALQQDRGLHLILVWSSPAPPRLRDLPPTVRRALRVLPALHWSPSLVRPSQSHFWKALKRAMPVSPLPSPSSSAPKDGLTAEA